MPGHINFPILEILGNTQNGLSDPLWSIIGQKSPFSGQTGRIQYTTRIKMLE